MFRVFSLRMQLQLQVSGRLSLHITTLRLIHVYFLFTRLSMKIIDIIKAGDPELFRTAVRQYTHTFNGYNVLHETIARGNVELSKIALDECPDLIYGEDYPSQEGPLVYAIKSLDMDLITLFDKYDVAFELPNFVGQLPIVAAIKTKCPDIISYVANKCPNALLSKDHKDRTPLHIAARYGCSADILSAVYTHAQNVPDLSGSYPLHVFGDLSCDDNYEYGRGGSVDFLFSKDPSVIFKQNKSGNTPLHTMATVPCRPGSTFFKDLVSVMKPESLRTKNNTGSLPVHIASLFHSIPFVNEMLTVCPDTLYATTPTSKSIFSFLEICHDIEKLEFVGCILSGDFEIKEKLWNFIPPNLKGLESLLFYIKDEHVSKALKFITSHGRYHLHKNLNAIHSFTKNMNIEPSIIKRIVLLSLRN
ncbi:ankyrin repeat-containing protein [Acanthocystis turfacea Chlorella virus Br0604L]|nr:ankyrin repeat-containing protein [Acanthocystis turfacea Chlorella virus Br0604L]